MPQNITFNDATPASAPANIAQAPGSPNWQHGGWRRELGFAAQRAKLVLHLEEVEERLTEATTGGGQSVNTRDLLDYRDRLTEELRRLENALPGSLTHARPMFIASDRS